jgi:hypothetical protein
MAKPNISAAIAPDDKAALELKASEILAILVFLVNLDPKTRKRLRKMATKRTGYVADVFTAVLANPGAIPSTFDVNEYKKDKQLFDDLLYLFGIFNPIVEAISDTMLMVGNELMTQSDSCYDYLKRAAKDNVPLTETINKIATAYKRQSPKTPNIFTIPAGGSVEVNNVVIGTRLVNNGTTVITLKAGPELPSNVKLDPIDIEPGNSVVIPKGYSVILVENKSATVEAIFSVRQK